jgi:hypothetical protein
MRARLGSTERRFSTAAPILVAALLAENLCARHAAPAFAINPGYRTNQESKRRKLQ